MEVYYYHIIVGKAKKVGIGIGVVIAAFFILVIAVGVSSQLNELLLMLK